MQRKPLLAARENFQESKRNKPPAPRLSAVRLTSQEAIMNTVTRKKFLKLSSTAATLLTAVALFSGAAYARGHKGKTSDNDARVVAHISFPGLSTVDMAIQQKEGNKYYLYVQHSKDQGISVIDISKPGEPKTLGVVHWP